MDIIIGAGITGLSYAMFKRDSDYLILECDEKIGGYCRTTCRNGYVWDYSGHFFHFQDKAIKEMVMEGLSDDEVVEVKKCTRIKYGDRLVDFPFQKNIHQLPQQEFIDCLVDLFESGATGYNTFKEMLYAKFGKSISEKFLIPYNEKLYAVDLDRLDSGAMGRFFPYAEKEEIVKNFRCNDNRSYNGTFVYPRGGAQVYVGQIAKHINQSRIRTGAEVIGIDAKAKTVALSDGERLHYDNLVSTLPFPRLLELTGYEVGEEYSWNKVLVFNLGFDSKGPDTIDHWLYFPEGKYCFYRVGFYDNILGTDRTSLYVELGFSKEASIDVGVYLDKVLHDLKGAGIITDNQTLVDYENIIMDPAYVHISMASKLAVDEMKRRLAQDNIYSIGRYNPQNETCDALRTKRAKIKTKRFSFSKRSVPLTRFPEHPFFKKISTRLRRDLPASRLSI